MTVTLEPFEIGWENSMLLLQAPIDNVGLVSHVNPDPEKS